MLLGYFGNIVRYSRQQRIDSFTKSGNIYKLVVFSRNCVGSNGWKHSGEWEPRYFLLPTKRVTILLLVLWWRK